MLDEELASANQRIDEMSIKNLAGSAAVVLKRKPTNTSAPPANVSKSNAAATKVHAKPKTS